MGVSTLKKIIMESQVSPNVNKCIFDNSKLSVNLTFTKYNYGFKV